jgi:hypothetical protein
MTSTTGTIATTTTSGSGGCGIDLTVARRLDDSLRDGIESREKSKRKEKRSSDLPVLESAYEKTKQRFSRLIEVAKNYNKHCALLDQSRLEVRKKHRSICIRENLLTITLVFAIFTPE